MNPPLASSPAATPRQAACAGPVLLVDDDPTVAFALKTGLEHAGLTVRLARNGAEGLALMRQGAFEWVVTDLIMPDMEGLEFIQAVRRSHPLSRIVAMSGGRTWFSDWLKMARFLGARHVLEKPFSYEQLVTIFRQSQS